MWVLHMLVLQVKKYLSQNIWVCICITPQYFLKQNMEKHLLHLTCLRWLELNYINHKSVVHFHCSELQDFGFGCTEYSHFENIHFNAQFKTSSSGCPSMRDINIQEYVHPWHTKITQTLKHLTYEDELKGCSVRRRQHSGRETFWCVLNAWIRHMAGTMLRTV